MSPLNSPRRPPGTWLFVASARAIWRGLRSLYGRASGRRATPAPAPSAAPIAVTRPLPQHMPPPPSRRASPPVPMEGYEAAVDRIAALLPYRGTRCVLTDGERAFWHPLRLAVRDRYVIFCKVRLADLAAAPDHRADSS